MIWTTLAPKAGLTSPFGTSGCNANHINATLQAQLEAGAQRTPEAVACKPLLGGTIG